jgi:hypothetical protein
LTVLGASPPVCQQTESPDGSRRSANVGCGAWAYEGDRSNPESRVRPRTRPRLTSRTGE